MSNDDKEATVEVDLFGTDLPTEPDGEPIEQKPASFIFGCACIKLWAVPFD